MLSDFFKAFRYHYAVLALLPFMAGMLAREAARTRDWTWVTLWVLSPVIGYSAAAAWKILSRRALFWLLLLPPGYFLYSHALGGGLRSGLARLEENRDLEVTGVVVSVPVEGRKAPLLDAELRAERVGGRPVRGKIKVRLAAGFDLRYGDRVHLTGRLRRPPAKRNPGGFDYRAYLSRRGTFALLTQRDPAKVALLERGRGPWFFERAVVPARLWIDRTVDRFAGKEGYMVKGILVGDKQDFPGDVRDNFRQTGLMHLLAVSGLNVGMVILIAYTFFSFFSMPLRARAALCMGIVWFYACLANLEPSMVRASVMGTVILAGTVFRRRSLIYNSLALAALIILILNPLTLFDMGFALSFLATLGLIYLYPRLNGLFSLSKLPRWAKPAAESLSLSLAATLATLPVLAFVFNQLAPVSIAANLFAVPVSFALLALGLLILFFAWWPMLASAYGASAALLTQLLNGAVEAFARVPYGYLECASPGPGATVFFCAFLVLIVHARQNRWARKGLFFAAAALMIFRSYAPLVFPKPDARITFLDVGQGDGIVVEAGGRCVLIDGGPREEDWDAGERVIYPYLRHRGIRKLTAVVNTHPDLDHLGGLPRLIGRMSPLFVFDNGDTAGTEIYGEYREVLGVRGPKSRALKAGERFVLSRNVYFDVLHPAEGLDGLSENNRSVVLRMVCGRHSLLFTGDIEAAGEWALARGIETFTSDLLKVAHHGSRTSTTEPFLDRVSPGTAVIQAGEWNRYGHPAREVVERLRSKGVRVCRTDRNGAVTVRLFAEKYTVETMF